MGTAAAVEANACKMEKLAREAAAGGAKIIVFPEACLTGYTSQAFLHNWHVPGRRLASRFAGVYPHDVVPRVDAPVVSKLVALAGELAVYMSIPFVEEADETTGSDGQEAGEGQGLVYYNSIVLASPAGKVAAHYRKTNLWPYVDESWATAGNSPAVVETEFGRLGLGICFDIHRLEQVYATELPLWALLYSVAWVGDREAATTEQWFRLDLRKRYLGRGALACHVIAANWSVDREYPWDGAGYSSIYNPRGERIAYLSVEEGDEILYADLPRSTNASTTAWEDEHPELAEDVP